MDPTYHDLGDHAETVEMDFDPSVVSYEELLDVFWSGHSPTRPVYSRQYMSAIFFRDAEQERAARESWERYAAPARATVQTLIAPAGPFYLAEDYHQKYRLRALREVEREFQAYYPDLRGFVDSTAVTRANAYASGCRGIERLELDLPRMGLSERAQQELRDAVSRTFR